MDTYNEVAFVTAPVLAGLTVALVIARFRIARACMGWIHWLMIFQVLKALRQGKPLDADRILIERGEIDVRIVDLLPAPTYRELRVVLDRAMALVPSLSGLSKNWRRILELAIRSIPSTIDRPLSPSGQRTALASASERESVFFIPFVNIFAPQILKADTFWAIWRSVRFDVLFLSVGYGLCDLIKRRLDLTVGQYLLPIALTTLLGILAMRCLRQVVNYLRIAKVVLEIPRQVRAEKAALGLSLTDLP
jgi:hypothetical protein